ncbi:MAG: hypothetical protein B7X57_04845 [Erythrobacter sp. 34-65-8]|nr:MAG: hypothetical protein B7X57_04845 [Erythrobacter sp. 34-65-8]
MPLALFPKFPDVCEDRFAVRRTSQLWPRVLKRQNPSFAAVNVFHRANKWADEIREVRIPGQKISPLLTIKDQMAAINGLRTISKLRSAIDRLAGRSDDQMPVSDTPGIEQVGGKCAMLTLHRIAFDVGIGKQPFLGWFMVAVR